MRKKFAGLLLTENEVWFAKEGGSVVGASAAVESVGEIHRRITATRLILTGPFALAFRKATDHRELYLTVEGCGFAFVV